jgi:hypothetical protein
VELSSDEDTWGGEREEYGGHAYDEDLDGSEGEGDWRASYSRRRMQVEEF